MAGTTNFVQVNPTAANQQNDSTYDSYSLTTDGVGVNAILPSPWLNKVWFQCTTFIAALASVIANFGAGFTITDATIATLETNLLDFFNSFLATSGNNSNGYWEKTPGGKITQWAQAVALGGGDFAITFPIAFTDASKVSINTTVVYADGDTGYTTVVAGSITTTGFTVHQNNLTGMATNWIAIGY